MMTSLLILLLFMALAALGAPLFVAIGLATLLCINFITYGGMAVEQSTTIVAEIFRITESPVLPAIPLFTLAGAIMTAGGISSRLIDLARALAGFLPGGRGVAAVVACAFFAALSGSPAVTVIAIGGIVVPALKREGFGDRFSLGLLTSSGAVGILFPPSLFLIIYGVMAHADIQKLFIAGVVPGVLTIVLLSGFAAVMGLRRRIPRETFSLRQVFATLRRGIWAALLPVLLLGGIYGGLITVTEAAAIAVVYALVIECFVHREVSLRDLPGITVEAMVLAGSILILLLMASSFTNFLTDEQLALRAATFIRGFVDSPLGVLIAINLLLLAVGCIMDILPAIVIFAPLLVPLAASFGVDPVHLGIVFVINMEIGLATPPFGINLLISSTFFRRPVVEVFTATLPFLSILLLTLALITYFPGLSLFLVRVSGL